MTHAMCRAFVIALVVPIVLVAVPAHAVTLVPVPVNQCLAGKLKCSRTLKHCLLKTLTPAGGTDSDPGGLHAKACHDRFDGGSTPARGCFAKLEANLSCLTTSDTTRIAQAIDAFVDSAEDQLDPPPAHDESKCRVGKVKCLDKYDRCVLDTVRRTARTDGVIESERLAKCTAILSGPKSCFAKLESKFACETVNDQDTIRQRDDLFLDDLVADLIVGPRAIDNRRCTGNLSVQCTAPADCTGIGTCEYFVGGPLPSGVAGVGTCIVNRISGALTGTVNVGTGAAAGSVTMIRAIYNGISQNHPCPTCDGDPFRNDGAAAGTCAGGPRNGLACDGNGVSTFSVFGTTSLDCPPAGAGLIGSLTLNLAAANEGTASLAITPASPVCRGLPSAQCPCDACSGATSTPCTSNADCVGFGTCGGGPAGEPPKPNSCLDGVCDLDVGNNQFVCANGPFDTHCVIETFRGCIDASDCPAAGDSCGASLRPCFPGTGAVGDAVTSAGGHGAPDLHAWTSRFGSTYCTAPTPSNATNSVLGLPGPGRIRVTGTLSDDGSTGSCPSLLTFVPDNTVAASDTGWVGFSHDEHVLSNAAVTAAVSGCAGAPPNCGQCAFNGPVPNLFAP